MTDAVMVLFVTKEGELLMHLRDDEEGVLHPGCWAGFGGAVESGESLDEAWRREMLEETGIELRDAQFLGDVVDEVSEGGKGDLVRLYVSKGVVRPEDIYLREGKGIGVFSIDELTTMRVSPFVMRTIVAHAPLLSAD